MSIRWITEYIGTSAALDVPKNVEYAVIDVRDIVDKDGNDPAYLRQKIDLGVKHLNQGNKVIVCCDYGISRSNAIAAGILASYTDISFDQAIKAVQLAIGEQDIKSGPISMIRKALYGSSSFPKQSSRKRILVTGGSGFVGRNLLPLLNKQSLVFAPGHSELDLENGPTSLDVYVNENQIDTIVHLATPKVYSSNRAMGPTLTMLRNIIEICNTYKLRLVFISSWEIWSGYSGRDILATINLPFFPKGPYGETKLLCENLINHHRSFNNLNCTIVRTGPLFGNASDKPRFIYSFINNILNNEGIITHEYDNGSPGLDLLWVTDFCDGLCKVILKGNEKEYHFGSGIVNSTKDIARSLMKILNIQVQTEINQIKDSTAIIRMDTSKVSALLKWKPKVTLENGLSRICNEIKEQRNE